MARWHSFTRHFCGNASNGVWGTASIASPPWQQQTAEAGLLPTVRTTVFVYNHLHTVHAIASCNAAEIAMGMLMEATVPTSHRWIPKSMNVQYLEKGTTSLRAQARLEPVPDFGAITEGADVVVPVSVVDTSGVEVVHADITTWVTPA
jgi:acyl-coenzyme A thioesterase PaaI-like protein